MAYLSVLVYFAFTPFLGANTLLLGTNSLFVANGNSLFDGSGNFAQAFAAVLKFVTHRRGKGEKYKIP